MLNFMQIAYVKLPYATINNITTFLVVGLGPGRLEGPGSDLKEGFSALISSSSDSKKC